MVEKVKNLNWELYSNIALFLSNAFILSIIIFIANNTKDLSNKEVIISYLVVGLVATVLLKLNHAASNKLKES